MPIRPINGFIVPGWTPPRHIRRGCYPKGLYERLNEQAGVNVSDLAIVPVMERIALAGCSDASLSEMERALLNGEIISSGISLWMYVSNATRLIFLPIFLSGWITF